MPDHDDELLSAYVDGELTPDERAQVEQRLRTDPQARELVEELRALSSVIKSLPRQTPGRDLRSAIDRVIDSQGADDGHRQVIPLSEPLDPPRGFKRGFLWSTIAIAAALLLMFTEAADEENQRDLAAAKNDAARERDLALEDAPRADPLQRSRELRKELPPMGEMHAAPAPESAPAAAPMKAPGSAGGPSPPDDSANRALSRDESAVALGGAMKPADAPPTIATDLALTDEAKLSAPAMTAGAAAGSAIAKQIPSVASIVTVELAVPAADAIAQVNRVLSEQGITVESASDESFGLANQSSPWAAEVASQYGFDRQSAVVDSGQETSGRFDYFADATKHAEQPLVTEDSVYVLIEASPAQVDQIVAQLQPRSQTFRRQAKEKSVEAGRRRAVEEAGDDYSEGGAAGAVATGDANQLPSKPPARAWIFAQGSSAFGGGGARDKSELAAASSSPHAGVGGGRALSDAVTAVEKDVPEEEALANKPEREARLKQRITASEPPTRGRVRVLLVLKPTSASSSISEAAAAPAVQAPPGEGAPTPEAAK